MKRGIFVGEGSSDRPLADIVTQLFSRRGIAIEIAAPDFSLLPAGKTRDLTDKITAARRLTASIVDVFVVTEMPTEQIHRRVSQRSSRRWTLQPPLTDTFPWFPSR